MKFLSVIGGLLVGLAMVKATSPFSFSDQQGVVAPISEHNLTSSEIYQRSHERLARARFTTSDNVLTIQSHRGGVISDVSDYFQKVDGIFSEIRLDGPCYSACLTLTGIGEQDVCATNRAEFFIHRPYSLIEDRRYPDPDASSLYPYISDEAKSYLERLDNVPIDSYIRVDGKELLPSC